MKHLFYFATAACMLAACSNNDTDLENSVKPINAEPIQLSQSVDRITARGIVESGSNVTSTILTCNATSPSEAWKSFTPQSSNVISEKTLTIWANVSTASFRAGEDAPVSLTTDLYYYTDNNTYLAAVAPAGTATTTTVNMQQQDGEQDVMYASADAGTKPSNSGTPIKLSFAHKTTQLNFALAKSDAAGTGDWDATIYVKGIAVQGAQVPSSVTFATGDVNWKTIDILQVPGISSSVIPAFGSTVAVGNSLMVNASHEIRLNVQLTINGENKNYMDVPVMKDTSNKLQTTIGCSHLITLTVKQPVTPDGEIQVATTATVEPWKTGTAGTGTLQ